MHSFPSRDAADRPEASYAPDMTALDAINDRLTEAVLFSLRRWRGQVPESREEFVACVVARVTEALEEKGANSFGEVLAGLIQIQVAAERAEAVLHAIALIKDRDNPALTTDCIAWAAGLHDLEGGISQTELADKHGVDRQCVNNRVTECQEALGLPTGRGGKSEEAREVYKDRAHEVHGTQRDPRAEAQKKTRTVIAAAGRVVQWFANIDLAKLGPEQKTALKNTFARLKPVCDAVALL